MKNLYFIRHGLSEHNILFKDFGKSIFYDKRYYDTKLVGQGNEESLHLGKTWDKINNIDIVFCSSLSRTIQTAINIFQDTRTKIYALDIIKEFKPKLLVEIEIHKMNMDNDIMKMRPLKDGLIIPANDITYLKPGDFHLMFFGLKKQMTPMETYVINLTFQNLGTIAVHALVKPSENGERLNNDKHNH